MKQPIIFFGDKQNAVPVITSAQSSAVLQKVSELATTHNFKKLIFPFQVHGTQGLVIIHDEKSTSAQSFTIEADWVITNLPVIGIGVLTADCVPILIHDPAQNAIGAVHAGWRGAVDGVVEKALQRMHHEFSSQPADLRIWIGPHARSCCYQVDKQFYDNVMQKPFGNTAWHKKQNTLFFDLKHCCMEQLIACGVPLQNVIDTDVCTICTPTYCSYRREKEAALRNISFVGILEQ